MKKAALLLLVCCAATARAEKLADLEAKRNAPKPSAAERARLERKLRLLVGKPPVKLLNIHYFHNRETIAFDPMSPGIDARTFGELLRCHFTGQRADMDMKLFDVLVGAARHFERSRIEIVSGFRAPKYNLILRKKGREVARDSQHTYGHAVDFQIDGVATAALVKYVRGLRLGGAGFYPASAFVHADTGPLRTWAGR